MFESILAPLDGSKSAEQAIPYVTELVRLFNCEVTLLGVCETDAMEQEEAFRLFLLSEVKHLRRTLPPQTVINSALLDGSPANQIIDYSEKNRVSLIILTSHGSSGPGPWALGGTVQKILHQKSTMPLLLVKVNEVGERRLGLFKRILLPLDGSIRGETALPYVIELSKYSEAEVVLLHVIEEGRRTKSIGGLTYVRFLDQEMKKVKVDAEKYLADIMGKFTCTKASIVPEIRTGEPAREILKMAVEQEQSLIALASHGHSRIDTWTFGSVSYKIIQSSKNPLLLVRS